jgi:hypothetical protein
MIVTRFGPQETKWKRNNTIINGPISEQCFKKKDMPMANKHMTRCSVSDTIMESQIQQVRYHYIILEIRINTVVPKGQQQMLQGYRIIGSLIYCTGCAKW